MVSKTDRKAERTRRHKRVRTKISGTAECPRLCVYRSNSNLYVQVVDDVAGNTLAQASTLDKEVKTKHANKEAAKEVGALIAKRAKRQKNGCTIRRMIAQPFFFFYIVAKQLHVRISTLNSQLLILHLS